MTRDMLCIVAGVCCPVECVLCHSTFSFLDERHNTVDVPEHLHQPVVRREVRLTSGCRVPLLPALHCTRLADGGQMRLHLLRCEMHMSCAHVWDTDSRVSLRLSYRR
jgi:hypothetical protein